MPSALVIILVSSTAKLIRDKNALDRLMFVIQVFRERLSTEKHLSVCDNTERHDGLRLFTVASSSSRVFSAMEGGALNTCLRVLKEIKWILSFQTCLLKFIEYFPDYLSALSRTLLCFFGQPLSKQLYTFLLALLFDFQYLT